MKYSEILYKQKKSYLKGYRNLANTIQKFGHNDALNLKLKVTQIATFLTELSMFPC